jgi:hypothetical protein
LAGVVCASTGVRAATWWRTVPGSACDFYQSSMTHFRCPFPSDRIAGATSIDGNATLGAIFADYTIGESGSPAVYISACGSSYSLNGGHCGTPVTRFNAVNGVYDVSVPLWTGTSSPWDYFYVSMDGVLNPIGIGVTGSN